MSKLCLGVIMQGSAGWVGGIEYGKNLVKALYRLGDVEVVPLAAGTIDPSLYADMPARFACDLRQNLDAPCRSLLTRIRNRLAGQAAGPGLLARAQSIGIDFLYPFMDASIEGCRVPSAAWIPDFQHDYYPEFFAPEELATRREVLGRMVRAAPRVVLSSQAAMDDFCRSYPEAANKGRLLSFCTVADDAWYSQVPDEVAKKHGLPERYFIVCNQFWQHKNHRVVFEALKILRLQRVRPSVVCTGKLEDYRRPGFAAEIKQKLEELGLNDQVHFLGLLPRSEQIQLLRRSLAVIQPSLFEGWSSVVEDARTLGKVIALSDLPVHREQNLPDAAYFDPQSAEYLAALLNRWWKGLAPGPDLQREKSALEDNCQRVNDYARCVVDIAAETAGRSINQFAMIER